MTVKLLNSVKETLLHALPGVYAMWCCQETFDPTSSMRMLFHLFQVAKYEFLMI
jgi:hypothetical protein